MNKILVIKNENSIIISQEGKRLIINRDNQSFDQIKNLTKEEIIQWYKNR